MCAKPNEILCPMFFFHVPPIYFFPHLVFRSRSLNLFTVLFVLLIREFMPLFFYFLQLFLQLHGIVSVEIFIFGEDKWKRKKYRLEKIHGKSWMNEWKCFFPRLYLLWIVNKDGYFYKRKNQPLNLGQQQWIVCIIYSWLARPALFCHVLHFTHLKP